MKTWRKILFFSFACWKQNSKEKNYIVLNVIKFAISNPSDDISIAKIDLDTLMQFRINNHWEIASLLWVSLNGSHRDVYKMQEQNWTTHFQIRFCYQQLYFQIKAQYFPSWFHWRRNQFQFSRPIRKFMLKWIVSPRRYFSCSILIDPRDLIALNYDSTWLKVMIYDPLTDCKSKWSKQWRIQKCLLVHVIRGKKWWWY